jgi:2-polyprenyl-3-methyl-5-hydroxy-6-metoxy-1,4-benzoquinol methylase
MNLPKIEGGVVVGNTYDKYGTRNPIARRLVDGFLSVFDELVERSGGESILEVGCGEGELAIRMARKGALVHGTDLSDAMVQEARSRAEAAEVRVTFTKSDLFDVRSGAGTYDLVVCCEVLEHLADPERAVRHLTGLSRSHLLFSVPREPLWRALNVVRGRYLRDLGNTPGHLQHWSRGNFHRLLAPHVEIVEERTPLPWLMALCRVRG